MWNLTPAQEKILQSPWQWRLASVWSPPELEICDAPAYRQWLDAGNRESHLAMEIVLALEGEVPMAFNDAVYRFSPGCALFLSPGVEHAFYYPPAYRHFTHLWLLPAPRALFADICTGNNREFYRRLLVSDSPDFCRYLSFEWQRLATMALDPVWRRQMLLGLLMSMVNKLILPPDSDEKPAEESPEDRRRGDIALLCRYIEEHSGRDISIARLAAMAHYSQYHFLRLFKEFTGLTVHAYVEKVRRKKLSEMEAAHARAKEIAAELGFANSASFANWRARQRQKYPT